MCPVERAVDEEVFIFLFHYIEVYARDAFIFRCNDDVTHGRSSSDEEVILAHLFKSLFADGYDMTVNTKLGVLS